MKKVMVYIQRYQKSRFFIVLLLIVMHVLNSYSANKSLNPFDRLLNKAEQSLKNTEKDIKKGIGKFAKEVKRGATEFSDVAENIGDKILYEWHDLDPDAKMFISHASMGATALGGTVATIVATAATAGVGAAVGAAVTSSAVGATEIGFSLLDKRAAQQYLKQHNLENPFTGHYTNEKKLNTLVEFLLLNPKMTSKVLAAMEIDKNKDQAKVVQERIEKLQNILKAEQPKIEAMINDLNTAMQQRNIRSPFSSSPIDQKALDDLVRFIIDNKEMKDLILNTLYIRSKSKEENIVNQRIAQLEKKR